MDPSMFANMPGAGDKFSQMGDLFGGKEEPKQESKQEKK